MFPLLKLFFKSVIKLPIIILFLQYIINIKPKIIPPKCAKWATPSVEAPNPKNISKAAYPITKYLALTGNGIGNTNI